MTIKTPEFQGTHLWDRLCWAKENLEGKKNYLDLILSTINPIT